VALMPFAINESTRFISPTKTPEYLAGGKPVVSTPVKDVIRHYGDLEGVAIAATADEFVRACDAALALSRSGEWLAEVDVKLANLSWDTTFARMNGLVEQAVAARAKAGRGMATAGPRNMTIWSSAPALRVRCSPSGWPASTTPRCW
jgi:UDP-galactopyranose mutase